MKKKYAVMEFDPSEGVHLYGVFDTAHEAVTWADEVGNWNTPWFVVDILDHQDTANFVENFSPSASDAKRFYTKGESK